MSLCILMVLLIVPVIGCKESREIEVKKEIPAGLSLKDINVPQRIVFGSCNRHDEPQRLWNDIMSEEADLWIWLGDIIYGDSEDLEVLKHKYDAQKNIAAYRSLREQTPITGIWDDHDYGSNNAGKEYRSRAGSRDLLYKFLDIPASDPSWDREGAYRQYYLGENQEVNLILLDSRYFRDQPIYDRDKGDYLPNTAGTMLGEVQWKWFEDILSKSNSEIHIIANGIQVIPEDHRYEKWSNFPLEREKLFDLITKYNVSRPVLISGDRHLSEVSRIDWNGQHIYEVTSSGMTHSYENVGDEPNRHRISKLVSQKSYAALDLHWEEQLIEVRLMGDEGIMYDSLSLVF